MKVLVVTTWLPTREKPEIGTFVARDIALLSRDHEVQVLHLASEGTTLALGYDDVPVTTVRMTPANPVSIRNAARAIAERAASVDVVHTMAVSALLPFIGRRFGRPWVHTEHWSALLAPSGTALAPRVAVPLIRRLLAKPDVVVGVGRRLAAAVRARRQKPTIIIPNAVTGPTGAARRPGGSVPTLVAVGGLIPRKGPDVAVRVIAELSRRGVRARLVWAGDGPMRAELIALARDLGVQEQIDLRGRVEPAAIGEILAEGDAFLLPTTMETFGVAIAEALVAGRPVVVGADGEQESFVAEPDGILVREQTAKAYADAVQRLLTLNADRSPDEIASRTRARFDEDSRRTEYARAYELAGARASAPDVDVVIAAHDPSRPIRRAVTSALSSASVARVIVVCHGVEPQEVSAAAAIDDERVEFVRFDDGVRSPAGPFNHGLDLATGRYASIMGSDDELTVGAIDAWRRTAEREQAAVVIAPLRHAGGTRVPTPPTLRSRGLRGARDRLAYRTAPLGLFDRETFGALRLTAGLATGEDLAFTSRMWFGSTMVSAHRGEGEYLIHDGDERVTFTHRPLSEELRAVELLIADPWTRALPARDRTALAVKMWRITIFGAVHYRAGAWSAEDRDYAADMVRRLRAFAPAALGRLARADDALLTALGDRMRTDAEVDSCSRRRRRFVSPAALVPRNLWLTFARESPLRFMAATWLASRR